MYLLLVLLGIIKLDRGRLITSATIIVIDSLFCIVGYIWALSHIIKYQHKLWLLFIGG